MFKELYSMLKQDEWYGCNESIEILKGCYAKPKSIKDWVKKIKRIKKYKN